MFDVMCSRAFDCMDEQGYGYSSSIYNVVCDSIYDPSRFALIQTRYIIDSKLLEGTKKT
jgi:hypothetical protein